MPPAEQVRDALARVLASDVFARSERARDLLSYLIDQDLAGNADRLKGFSIAVDVFGKDVEFDPSQDTVVRVQAGRLRNLLDQYYTGPGADDPLRIVVPRGSYVPDYVEGSAVPFTRAEARASASAVPSALPGAGSPLRRNLSLIAVAAVVLVLVAALFGTLFLYLTQDRTPGDVVADDGLPGGIDLADVTGLAQKDLLPSVYADFDVTGPGPDIVAGAMRRGLTSFETVDFIARPLDTLPEDGRAQISFLMTMEAGPAEGEIQLELQHVASGKVLISRSIDTDGLPRDAIEDRVANLLTTVAPVSGVLYASITEAGTHTILTRCLDLNERFYRSQSAETHRVAHDCLQSLERAGLSSSLVFSELSSLEVQALVNRYDYPPDATWQDALDHARHAVQLSPGGAYAHRAMGYVLTRMGSQEEGLRWTKRAYELNTFDLGMAASYGYALVFSGSYADGSAILTRAVNAASSHPTWWDYGLFLGLFMTDNMQAAANVAAALASSERPHYLAVQLIVASHQQRQREVERLLSKLRSEHAGFSSDPMAFFRRGDYPEDMALRLVEALRLAGLDISG